MKQTVVKIDDRIDHIVDFETSASTPDTYILANNGSTRQTLLSFYAATRAEAQADGQTLLQTDISGNPIYVEPSIDAAEVYDAEDGTRHINITIQISDTPHKPGTAKGAPAGSNAETFVSIERASDSLNLVLKRGQNPAKDIADIYVIFKLVYKGDQYIQSTRLYCVPRGMITDGVVDFGSDATQALLCLRDHVININSRIDIFNAILDTLGHKHLDAKHIDKTPDHERYEQCVTDNLTLYRSAYFARQTISDAQFAASPVAPVLGSENLTLRMLTTMAESDRMLTADEADRYVVLPSVKLSRFGGLPQPLVNGVPAADYKDSYFYHLTLNRFVLALLKKGLHDYDQMTSDPDRDMAFVLRVLMPNVYGHHEVEGALRHLRTDVEGIIAANPALARIKAVEIEALSESDASILGAYTSRVDIEQIDTPDGTYLIIDVGKGTVDFSVMEIDKAHFNSIYRGGFIGAGATLTTAYTLALVHEFVRVNANVSLTYDQLIEYVYSHILAINDPDVIKSAGKNAEAISESGDPAYLHALERAVERYKCTANKAGAKSKPALEVSSTKVDYETLRLSTFIEFVKKLVDDSNHYCSLSADAMRYVNNAVENIAENTCAQLKVAIEVLKNNNRPTPFRGVILAGRGFKHIGLHKAMLDKLKDNGWIKEPQTKDPNKGVPTDQNTMGEVTFLDNAPDGKKMVCLYITPMLDGNRFDNFSSSVLLNENRQPADTPYEKLKGCLRNKLRNMFGIKKTADTAKDTAKDAAKDVAKGQEANKDYSFIDIFNSTGRNTYGSVHENILPRGKKITITDPNCRIIVNGTIYRAKGVIKPGQYTLFFTSTGLGLRTRKGEWIPLQTARLNLRGSNLVLPTLFPFISLQNNNTEVNVSDLHESFKVFDMLIKDKKKGETHTTPPSVDKTAENLAQTPEQTPEQTPAQEAPQNKIDDSNLFN